MALGRAGSRETAAEVKGYMCSNRSLPPPSTPLAPSCGPPVTSAHLHVGSPNQRGGLGGRPSSILDGAAGGGEVPVASKAKGRRGLRAGGQAERTETAVVMTPGGRTVVVP